MSDSFSSPTRKPGFIQGLAMFILFIAGIEALTILLYQYQVNLPLLWMTVFANISLGLAAGIGARAIFYNYAGFVRFLIVLPGLGLALYALGYFTNWKMGIGPLEKWLGGYIDWMELWQIAGGILVALLALRAWRRSPARIVEAQARARRSNKRREQARSSASAQLPRFELPRFQLPRFQVPHFQFPEKLTSNQQGRMRLKPAHRAKAQEKFMPEAGKMVVARPPQPLRAKRRKAPSRKPELQLSVYEEHRCPYCLEEVKRNDPRGVKECEICHTLHHADCWNITGMCQIPHLNS